MKSSKITLKGLDNSYRSLIKKSRLDFDFILLTFGAAAICAFGFKMNSPSVIIGAMVISPLLYPVVSLGVSTLKADLETFKQGLLTGVIGLAAAVGTSTFLNLFLVTSQQSEIVERLSSAPIDYFFVALVSGMAGTFAYFWPNILEAIAGIAISVALIPPVVIVGVGLAHQDIGLILSGSIIVAINILGIYLGAVIMFFALRYLAGEKGKKEKEEDV